MNVRQWPEVVGLALLCACGGGGGDDTSVGTSTSTSGVSTGVPTTGASTEGVSTGSDTGVEPPWPPPFMPTPTVDVVLDPGLMLGEGPCIHRCDPADREELPPVMVMVADAGLGKMLMPVTEISWSSTLTGAMSGGSPVSLNTPQKLLSYILLPHIIS